MMKKDKIEGFDAKIKFLSAEPLSPHTEVLYEVGKDMVKSSINTGNDFCKFMIPVSTGAIPIYLGLLKFVLPEDFTLPASKLVLSIVPPILFFVSAIIFILGYFPRVDRFSLEIVGGIERAYEKTVNRRGMFINCGIAVFLVGSAFAIFSIILHIIGR